MPARDVTYGIGHAQDRQSECKGDSDEADAELRLRGGNNCRTAPPKYEPEGAQKFGYQPPLYITMHDCTPLR